MEVKYEPIFGDQSLFYGAPEDAVSVRYGKSEYIFDSEEIKATTGQLRDVPVVAMRRIIKTPKRWTWEDKKAGRLPEVGAGLTHESEGDVSFIGEYDCRWMLRTKYNGLYLAEKFYCYPIETPEERAKRVREEWINHAYEKLISADVKGKASLGDIYDALVSGELKMPEVQ